MDWVIFLGLTLAAALLVALVARDLARRMARMEGEPTFTAILLAIVISAVVLLGAAKLAVAVDWAYAMAGVDARTAILGQFRMATFVASFVPIAAYVGAFFVTFTRARRA